MPDALARLARLALDADDVGPILRAAVRDATRALRAPLAQALEADPGTGMLSVGASVGWGRGEGARAPLPGGDHSHAGFALGTSGPVVLEDAAAEGRFDVAEARRGREVRSGVAYVILGVKGPFGVLTVHSPRPREFGPEDADRLRWIADIVALAVARVRTARRATEVADLRGRLIVETIAAGERERSRLADVLHDGPIQNVVTAGYDLDASMMGNGDGERIRRARKAIGEALRQMRSTMQDLHPIALEAAGLTVALDRLCGEQRELSGAELVADLRAEAEGSHDRLLFDLARELVGNAVRHAGASRIEVSTGREGDEVVLRVADDGRGMRFDSRVAAVRAGHIGLACCVERVDLAGGRLDIDSARGRGTVVTARLPAVAASD